MGVVPFYLQFDYSRFITNPHKNFSKLNIATIGWAQYFLESLQHWVGNASSSRNRFSNTLTRQTY